MHLNRGHRSLDDECLSAGALVWVLQAAESLPQLQLTQQGRRGQLKVLDEDQ